MKHRKIFKLLGLAVILSILLLSIPVLPALAVNDIYLNPATGKVGDTISISGTNFSPSTDSSEKYARIIFAADSASVGQYIDLNVDTYYIVKDTQIGFEGEADEGDFSTTFTVPLHLTDGADDADVTAGTYYIYVVTITSTSTSTLIKSMLPFTVTSSGTLDPLSPTTGSAGTTVNISGSSFPASTAIVFKFDSTVIAPTSGDTATRTSGVFISTIAIPTAATAGTHTVSVTVGSTTVSTTFTVTASASLDPLSPTSGQAGTAVVVSGANFPPSTALVFKLDTDTIIPTSGDASTRSSGIFLSTITIPTSTAAGAHTITATAGTGTASATFTVTAGPTLDTPIPESGASGSTVTLTGSNFLASYPMIIMFDDVTITPKAGDTSTQTTGSFNTVITIPADATAGAHEISVTVSTVTEIASFTVTSTEPPPATTPPTGTLSMSQTTGAIGQPIIVGGSGFTPGAMVTISYDGKQIGTGQAKSDGTYISDILTVPISTHGEHKFAITDGTHTSQATFTVESDAPTAPTPVLPLKDTKAKSPISFDWVDVTDNSSPVTYEIQIATSKDFSTSSIVLDKKGLTKSDYTYTESSELKLASQAEPYYWRVKATDAADNEGAWSNAGQFYLSPPFTFPKWAIILIACIGGVFLFLLGLWVGRRTAFYY
jgi:hypothetical protein